MADSLLLVENYYNKRIFPGHAVTGDEEAVGSEAFRVGDGRRSPLDGWQPITTNAAHRIIVSCDQTRAPSAIFLDRGHNLAGLAGVKYQTAPDGSSWSDIWTVTIPAIGAGGTDITAANGCTTEEGAWGKVFTPPTAALWHALYIPAMGVGLNPLIVGIYLGTPYLPGKLIFPWDEDQNTLHGTETVSPMNWKGRSPILQVRDGDFGLQLLAMSDYTTARYHLRQLYGNGRPMWICYDQAQADRAFLTIRPLGGRLSIGLDGN